MDNRICIWLEDVWSERCHPCAAKVSEVCVETTVVVDTLGPARRHKKCNTHKYARNKNLKRSPQPMLLLDTDPLRPSCVRHRHFRSRSALHRCQHISGFGVQTKMPNFRGCQPFLVIVQSPDGSTYQFVIPAYSYVGPRKSQTHLQVMAEEYLEEHVLWGALLNDPENDRLIKIRHIRPFRRWREY